MKITKASKQTKREEKAKANKGCEVCPCCGEEREGRCIFYRGYGYYEYGIFRCQETRSKGFLNIQYFSVDTYECSTCGAKWESEPYDFRKG